MICHQRVCPNADSMIHTSALQGSNVHKTIGFIVEHGISPDSALTHVMGILRKDTTSRSRHNNFCGVGSAAGLSSLSKKGPDVSFPFSRFKKGE